MKEKIFTKVHFIAMFALVCLFAIGSAVTGYTVLELIIASWNSGEMILGFAFYGICIYGLWKCYNKD